MVSGPSQGAMVLTGLFSRLKVFPYQKDWVTTLTLAPAAVEASVCAVLGCDNGPGFEEEDKLTLRADLMKVVFKETVNEQSGILISY